jgi:hypothetical protein
MWATEEGHEPLVEMLLQQGAHPNTTDKVSV